MSVKKAVEQAVKATVDNSDNVKKQEDFVRRAAIVRAVVEKACHDNKIDLVAELRYGQQGILPVPIYVDASDKKETV